MENVTAGVREKCVKRLKRLRSEEVTDIIFQTNVGEKLVFTFPRNRTMNKDRNV